MIKQVGTRALLLVSVLISVQTVASTQQEPVIEYGSIADLKGVESIFIYTGADIELRNKLVKEITKQLKNVVVTDKPSEGQVCLVYGSGFETYYAGTVASGTVTDEYDKTKVQAQSTPQYRKVTYGSGSVVIMKPNNIVRIIMNFQDSKGDKPPLATLFERKPSTNFARAFVKAYKEANKEKR